MYLWNLTLSKSALLKLSVLLQIFRRHLLYSPSVFHILHQAMGYDVGMLEILQSCDLIKMELRNKSLLK